MFQPNLKDMTMRQQILQFVLIIFITFVPLLKTTHKLLLYEEH